MGIGSLIGGAASLVSGLFGSQASSQAANQQVQEQQQALQLQQQMFGKVQQNLSPYMGFGTSQLNNLTSMLPQLTAQFNPTMQQLESTPGYQFTLNQGIQGLDNNYSAQGLGGTSSVWGQPGADGKASSTGPQGPSGALGKALASYTTGLASNTYQQQFQNYLSQNSQIYNMLNGGISLGENAAAGVGNAAMATGQGMSNTLSNIGTAQAQGTLGSTAALTSGLNGAASNASLFAMMNGGGNPLSGYNQSTSNWMGLPDSTQDWLQDNTGILP